MTKKFNKVNSGNIMQEYQATLANLGKALNVMAELLGALTEVKVRVTNESETKLERVRGIVPAATDARKLSSQVNNGSSGDNDSLVNNGTEEFAPDAMVHNRSSQYMGVTYAKGYKHHWEAKCCIGHEKPYKERFESEIEAKRAYEAEKARRLAGVHAKKKSVYAVAPTMEATQFDVLENDKVSVPGECPLLNDNACGVIAGYHPSVWIKWVQDTLKVQAKGKEDELIARVVKEINHAKHVNIKNRLYFKQRKMLYANMHPLMISKVTVLNVLAENEFRYEATKALLEILGNTEMRRATNRQEEKSVKKLA